MRLIHAAHGVGRVIVRVSGHEVTDSTRESAISKYAATAADSDALIEVEGSDKTILASTHAAIAPGKHYTVELTGTADQPVVQVHDAEDGLFRIVDDESIVNPLIVSISSVPDRTPFLRDSLMPNSSLFVQPSPSRGFYVDFFDVQGGPVGKLEFTSLANLSVIVLEGPSQNTLTYRVVGSDDGSADL